MITESACCYLIDRQRKFLAVAFLSYIIIAQLCYIHLLARQITTDTLEMLAVVLPALRAANH